ncbi:hypothetical protein AAY473_016108 [Plecturocebus cupreus]
MGKTNQSFYESWDRMEAALFWDPELCGEPSHRQGLALLPRLECNGRILLCGPGWSAVAQSRLTASASRVAGVTGTHQHIWLIFVFLVEMAFHHVGQAGLEILTSSDPPALVSQRSHSVIQAGVQCGVIVHCNLNLLGLRDPPTSASQMSFAMLLRLRSGCLKVSSTSSFSPFLLSQRVRRACFLFTFCHDWAPSLDRGTLSLALKRALALFHMQRSNPGSLHLFQALLFFRSQGVLGALGRVPWVLGLLDTLEVRRLGHFREAWAQAGGGGVGFRAQEAARARPTARSRPRRACGELEAWARRRRRRLAGPSRAGPSASVGPPHGLLQARGGRHVGGGVAVAALGLHHVALVREAGVEQRRAGGGVGAGRQDARRRALAAHHGELVGAGRSAVVQVIGGRAGLERAALRLR